MQHSSTDGLAWLALLTGALTRRFSAVVYALLATALTLGILVATSSTLLERPQVEPDDFRFIARALGANDGAEDEKGPLSAGLVENRWDMLPFVDVEGGVRFWRPMLPLSFALDARASDGFHAGGSKVAHARFEPVLLTNLVLHAACCLLAFAFCALVAGPSLAATLGALLFCCFAPHAEAIWYGAGRNATLLALSFVGAWLLHGLDALKWPVLRRVFAPLAYAAALGSKETAVVFVFVALADDLLRRRRLDRVLYATYAAITVVWFVLRSAALAGAAPIQFVEPYVYSPFTAAFWPHVLVSIGGLLDAIGRAAPLAPFLRADEFAQHHQVIGMVLGFAVLIVAIVANWRSVAGRSCIVFLFATWLPTLPVYVSERYFYLPSFAFCALIAGVVAAKPQRGAALWRYGWPCLAAIATCWLTVTHYRMLASKHRFVSAMPRAGWAVSHALEEVAPELGKLGAARIVVVDFPGDVVHAQFFADQVRVETGNRNLDVRVLNLLPPSAVLAQPGKDLRVERSATALRLRGVQRPVLSTTGARLLFPLADLVPGTKRTTRDGSVTLEINEGDGQHASVVSYELNADFAKARVLRFVAPSVDPPAPNPVFTQALRISQGRFVLE